MIDAPAPVVSLLVNGVHRLCTCWKIERTDSVVFRFTDHNEPITFDGEVYSPSFSPIASAKQRTDGIDRAMNVEVRGCIASSNITDDDLRAGKFRGAKITEIVVDWKYPWSGLFQKHVYWIRETTSDRESWTAQCEGLLGRLQGKVGQVLNRTCRHRLGDAKCQYNVAAVEEFVAVDGSTNRYTFTATLAQSGTYYDGGKLTWDTGDNAGVVCEVKSYDSLTQTVTLQISAPFDIVAGDAFTVQPGCDGNLSTCRQKFNNVVNFGGFPNLVSVDRQFATPGAPV
jgi:uncharacterized phage protein (TIGR02218 family)